MAGLIKRSKSWSLEPTGQGEDVVEVTAEAPVTSKSSTKTGNSSNIAAGGRSESDEQEMLQVTF